MGLLYCILPSLLPLLVLTNIKSWKVVIELVVVVVAALLALIDMCSLALMLYAMGRCLGG